MCCKVLVSSDDRHKRKKLIYLLTRVQSFGSTMVA